MCTAKMIALVDKALPDEKDLPEESREVALGIGNRQLQRIQQQRDNAAQIAANQ